MKYPLFILFIVSFTQAEAQRNYFLMFNRRSENSLNLKQHGSIQEVKGDEILDYMGFSVERKKKKVLTALDFTFTRKKDLSFSQTVCKHMGGGLDPPTSSCTYYSSRANYLYFSIALRKGLAYTYKSPILRKTESTLSASLLVQMDLLIWQKEHDFYSYTSYSYNVYELSNGVPVVVDHVTEYSDPSTKPFDLAVHADFLPVFGLGLGKTTSFKGFHYGFRINGGFKLVKLRSWLQIENPEAYSVNEGQGVFFETAFVLGYSFQKKD